jgi:hypothetical protein
MRTVILSSIISPAAFSAMAEFPQRVRRAQKGPVLVSARLQTTLHFTTESGSKSSHFHGISPFDGS